MSRSKLYALGAALGLVVGVHVLWSGCGIQDVFAVAGTWASPTCPQRYCSIIMRVWLVVDFLAACFLTTAPTSSATSNVSLPSYPLAVKSPYLSTWVPGNQLSTPAVAQAQFWTGKELTWPILARVDGTTYALFGSPHGLTSVSAATGAGVEYTSTHTLIHLTAGGAKFTLDFFTPVYPKAQDYALQSLPYSYLTINAVSTTSAALHIEVFTAIDYTWTAQDGAAAVNYTTAGNATGFFWFHNSNQVPYTEDNDMATYGSVLFGTADSNVTYSCNSANTVYSSFASIGSLSSADRDCSGRDLAAFAKDLGEVGISGASATFAVGFERELTIKYLDATQTGYHRSRWPTIPEAITYFLGHYSDAYSASGTLDKLVRSKTESVSSDWGSQYADICEASVRQAFAALALTVPADNLTASPSVFLKEISSDGNMNTVDLIFQSWPIFINLNPEWIILQFKPTLSYLASGRWPKEYFIHDIGAHYPNATGHDDGFEESMPLFETSSFFILMLAYQQASGDDCYTKQYISLLDDWAQFLVRESLYPTSQLISVDAIAATPNQTALAIQSTIGLKAASVLLNNSTYSDIADSFAKTIYNDALGLDGPTLNTSTHFTYNYGNRDSWNVVFTSYSDVFLNLSTFPQAAWDLQSSWYSSQVAEAGLAWAGPVADKGVDWAITDWNLMTAAVSSSTLQQQVVSTTHAFMTNGLNTIPFGTKYYVSGADAGVWIGNKARGTVGTHFALTALQQGLWTY